MIKRALFAIFGFLSLYISLFIFMISLNIIVFVVHVENFPGGTIEIGDGTRHISKKDGYIAFIQQLNSGSGVTLKCAESVDRDGYFLPLLDQFIYIEIDGCHIKYVWGYDLIYPFMIIFDFLIQIYIYMFN
ncbi:hypothetical protein [Ancylobacter rudongensis]|uniref:hypothetical protein n=1 Tax=Ancylobacter rudongensis TaxID=177413 RepID=UPI001967BFB8|nr:hypothetical protein [Ancylobacter rudongensis]